jgi:hypothetical protein
MAANCPRGGLIDCLACLNRASQDETRRVESIAFVPRLAALCRSPLGDNETREVGGLLSGVCGSGAQKKEGTHAWICSFS